MLALRVARSISSFFLSFFFLNTLVRATTFRTPLPFHGRVWMQPKASTVQETARSHRIVVRWSPRLVTPRLPPPPVHRDARTVGDECSNPLAEWMAEWCLFWVQVLALCLSGSRHSRFSTGPSLALSFLFRPEPSRLSLTFLLLFCFFLPLSSLSLSRRSRNTAATRLLCDKKKRRKLVCPLAEYHTHVVGAPSLAHARFRISSSSFSLFVFFFCFLLVFSRSIQCAINEFDTGSYSGQTPLFTLVQSTYAFQENNGQ